VLRLIGLFSSHLTLSRCGSIWNKGSTSTSITGETEVRLSHLVGVRQKHNESAADYVRRFQVTRNKCYSLTIGEKDLAELAFVGLTPAM
jgi:hypothetical protein